MRRLLLAIATASISAITALSASCQNLADAYDRAHTSVVTIRAKSGLRSDLARTATERIGSGVLLSKEGLVLTAAHVVHLADEILVEFADGTRIPAKIIGAERGPDLARLELEQAPPRGATVAVLGDSDKVRVGNRVFVIGAPLTLGHSLTVGYISAKRKHERLLGPMRHIEHFQTDAAIQKGNSGGPMFNMKGEVIGIVCHIVSSSGGNEGLGFVVTSNVARAVLRARKGIWLGFDALALSPKMSRALNIPDGKRGLLVQGVAESSPAKALGLHAGTLTVRIGNRDILLGGDVILEILGHSLSNSAGVDAAMAAIRGIKSGEKLRMKVLRAGREIELSTKFKR